MIEKSLAALAVSLFTLPAAADPAVGVGLSFTFGGTGVDTGIGIRVMSNDEADSFAATIGLDYMIGSQRFRPTVGAAYLGTNRYVGMDVGFDLQSGAVDFGASAGYVETQTAPIGFLPPYAIPTCGPGEFAAGPICIPVGGPTGPLE